MTGHGPVGVAVVGCGTVSHQYLPTLITSPDLRVVACADLDLDRAGAVAARYGVPHATDVPTALHHPDVELVVNLTIPAAHDAVAGAAIAAGRHVYNEKPLSMDRESGGRLLAAAADAGVRVGGAPDTFLTAGTQAALAMLAEGAIGTPQTALLLLQSPGPESWHESPEFLYQRGAGPLFDLGPYYLTALASAFGPAGRVAAAGRRAFPHRTIGAGPRAGTSFPVEVPTHVTALVEFVAGQVATLVFSFDSPLSRAGFLEITGTTATLALPDPNGYDGHPRLRRATDDDWVPVPISGQRSGRGIGVVEMARAIRLDRPHRASGEQALHVLDLMMAIAEAADTGGFVTVKSSFTPAAPLPSGWDPTVATIAATSAGPT
ncbi:Gfo/Idh/MocA family oxidoreductase [Polymorphospora sp. NPDC050346]|uniref:Gfo/Idh/MocA family protein n=1 Tax=Polymorphospora sp. NPDC050346 TaxID=3155780 RepID=UPI0033FE446D